MRRFIGTIETVLGFLITTTSLIGIFFIKKFFDSLTIPSALNDLGLGEVAKNVLNFVPFFVIAYIIIILLLGILIFLEGLSKLENYKLIKIKEGKKSERSIKN